VGGNVKNQEKEKSKVNDIQRDCEVTGVKTFVMIVIWAVSGCVLPCKGHISSAQLLLELRDELCT
jgi:hypothetical protein